MARYDIVGDTLQPGQRVVGNPLARPCIQRAHPRFLNEILRQTAFASNPPRNIGVQRADGLPISQDQVIFAKHSTHSPHDDVCRAPKPTFFFPHKTTRRGSCHTTEEIFLNFPKASTRFSCAVWQYEIPIACASKVGRVVSTTS